MKVSPCSKKSFNVHALLCGLTALLWIAAAQAQRVFHGGFENRGPDVTIKSPQDASTYTFGQSVSFTGRAFDREDKDLSANLLWTSSLDGEIGSGATFDHAGLSAGNHTVRAEAIDSDGNSGAATITLTIVGQSGNLPPTVTITEPSHLSRFETGATITFGGGAADDEDGDLSAQLAWSSSLDGPIGEGVGFSTTGLSVGTHVVTASVTDSRGDSGSAQVTLSVDPPDLAPTASIVAPADGSVFMVGETIGFVGSAADDEDGDLGDSLSWSSSRDGPFGSGSTVDHAGLSAGTHTITAAVTDSAGQSDTATISITVRTNSAPVVTITSPADSSSFAEGESIRFAGSAYDAEDGDVGNFLSWTSDLDGAIGSGPSFDHFSLSPGAHTITASVTDSDGQTGSTQVNLTVSSGVPESAISIPLVRTSDDAEESPAGGMYLTSSDLELGLLDGTVENYMVGLRFDNVPIEALSTIVSAQVQFTTDEVWSDPVSLTIEGEASDDAATFDLSDYNISDRPRTARAVSWAPAGWPILGEAADRQRTPDLAEIINEIVDRPGWASGNALVLLVSGDGRRAAESFDKTNGSPPVLHVTYNAPGGNRRPVVDAGADQVAGIPAELRLDGVVSDDGLPTGEPLVTLWSHVGGTGVGAVTFEDPFALDSAVSIEPEAGTYILRLTADDGEFSSSDELQVTVTSNTGAASAGTVKIHMKIYQSTYQRLFDEKDDFGNSQPLTDAQKAEMAGMYGRLTATSPSFDRHLSWFPEATEYEDLYKIDPSVGPGDPLWEYVLKDAQGNPLYIDFACTTSPSCDCPQLAGDFGDQGFRDFWIDRQRGVMQKGYGGMFVDDIALNKINTSDACGNPVTPIDERTGKPMTLGDMQTYMAEFAEQIRAAFPAVEITHNAIFAAQPADSPPPGQPTAIDRQLMAADTINIETGAPVARGGFHNWGFESWLAFVDRWHAEGKHFVLHDDNSVEDDDGEIPYINAGELRALRYQLAVYYLINDGGDYLGADGDAQKYRVYPSFYDPNAFSPDYQHDLGDAVSGHYQWNGLFRRDFQCGMVLVNQPEQSTISVALGQSYTDLDGQVVTSVTLPAVSGAVLRKPCGS